MNITIPETNEGERYCGIIVGDQGVPMYHLILLPGETEGVNWSDAKAWAEKVGGDLPSRSEQALLFANAKDVFEGDWYWSNEQHAGDESYAWCQDFGDGYQSLSRKDDELRARAVRRVPIQEAA